MKVREITIESHEKRAHPHSMGHRDVSITLTARLDKDDDPALMAEVLQAEADAHVDKYLDEWIATRSRPNSSLSNSARRSQPSATP